MNHFDLNRAYGELKDRYNLHFVDILLKNNFKVYLFGGSLRDMVMGREWKDADIRAWINLPQKDRDEKTETLLKEIGEEIKSISKFNDTFTVFRFLPKHSQSSMSIDLSVVSDQWLVGPDFTINGLYFDLESKELIDQYDAVKDIENKIIKTAKESKQQFTDEPYMIFRAVKAACQFNFQIEANTFQAMKELSGTTEGVLQLVADNTVPGLTEWFLGNLFAGLKYNPVLWEKLWKEVGVMNVFIHFIEKRLALSSTREIEQIFDQNKKYTWEEAINTFISATASMFNGNPSENFKKIIDLFSITKEKQYQDFMIDNLKITFTNE